MKYIVIGISDHPEPFFSPDVLDIIKNGKVFSGGKRHHEIVAPLLPADAQWIDITVPLDAVFEQYKTLPQPFPVRDGSGSLIVFASGDPLFFGFANTIKRKMPEAEMVLYPSFNSLQLLAHRLLMPYHDMRIVSLTGRPWPDFDKALIERVGKIGVLTDREHTPATIAQRMMEYGYTQYQMFVGEHLGNPNLENKMPIRLLTLQALDLPQRHVLWDIGFCTGSVSIEAKLQFPHLQIEAFEIRPECETIIRENARRFGTPGINIHMGDFLETDISSLPRPDAVFIGGHGGKLKSIMTKVLTVLADDGCIVMNSVKAPKVLTDSHQLWDEACLELGLKQELPMRIIIDGHHPIEILKAHK